MTTRRLFLGLALALAAPVLAPPVLAAEQHGSRRLENGLTEITGFLDRVETEANHFQLIVTADGEKWTVDFPDPPANANDTPVGLQLSEGMELTIQGHQAQDTAYRMRADVLIIDGTPYEL
ncbi:hypothetical protein [Marinibacterium profundimaris]|uniref:Bacterial OB-fold domain-containing protein n=1 Tax=Marinibacterium profundimaris TaxID=1679460 RepID=A0A225NW43_9RHOB|nr:hypothetical protein [Marinibacterium profundimaris]OWU77488.1 hypothetical protein ATO3_01950 [Marinibacterium profundimaris]